MILLHNQKKETQINTKIQLLTRGKNLLKRTSPSPLQRGFCFAFYVLFPYCFFVRFGGFRRATYSLKFQCLFESIACYMLISFFF